VSTTPSKATRAFVSYSHDSLPHRERVLAFTDRLRRHGVEAIVDRYFEDTLEMRWTDWMADEIEQADFVLVVATSGYRDRLKVAAGGTGKGAYWEGALITQHLYEGHGHNAKFLAVHFGPADAESVPTHLKGFTSYDVESEEGYLKLYRRLTRQPGVVPPAIGPVVHPNQLYASQPPPIAPTPRGDAVKQRIEDLARAYQELRRSTLPGDERTRKMEVIATKMRTAACDAYYLLEFLAKNPEPGARLAAVSLLEARPNVDYLDWLAERLAPEKPFVGYHAALALLVAARALEQEYREPVRNAILKAQSLLGPGLESTDRGRALAAALLELDAAGALVRDLGVVDRPLPI
jgi:hypothetical protein